GGVTSILYGVTVRVTGLGILYQAQTTVPPDQTIVVKVPATFAVSGRVADGFNISLNGAAITIVSGGFAIQAASIANGAFVATVPGVSTVYRVIVSKAGYLPSAQEVTIAAPTALGTITLVSVEGQNTIAGSVDGPPSDIAVTVTASNADGRTVTIPRGSLGPNCTAAQVTSQTAFCITVGPGTWTVKAAADGFAYTSTNPSTVNTTSGSVTGVTVAMASVTTTPLQAQQCLDTAGCRAEAKGSRIIMIVPPGAAGSSNEVVTITIKETTNAPDTGNFTPALTNGSGVPVALDFVIRNSLGVVITQFALPLNFTIEGLGTGSIVGYLDDATRTWIPLTGCTASASGISCSTTHLTKFSILSVKSSAAPSTGGGGGGGGGGWAPIIVGPPVVTAGTINSGTGGSLSTPRIWTELPAGVLTTPVQMTGRINENPVSNQAAALEGALFTTAVFSVELNNILGPSINNLDKAATINVRLTAEDLALVCGDASLLRVRRYDEASGKWVDLPITSASSTVISATTEHLSLFAVVAALPAPGATSPSGGSLVVGLDPTLAWGQACFRQYHVQVAAYNNDGPGIDMIIGRDDLTQLRKFPILAPNMGVGSYVLLPGMTYTWRVRTSPLATALGPTDKGWSDYSEPRTFRTGSVTSATITVMQPPNGSSVTDLTPLLQWANRNPLIFYYEVQLSEDATFETDPSRATAAVAWELSHGGQSSPLNSYRVKRQFALKAGATYYWRVR
ncbi:MAG: hypothetical protein NTZ05_07175, partial [Chloroflexi bacterium]|nr:hypothetical protein [Chloroflexota bacterium]